MSSSSNKLTQQFAITETNKQKSFKHALTQLEQLISSKNLKNPHGRHNTTPKRIASNINLNIPGSINITGKPGKVK